MDDPRIIEESERKFRLLAENLPGAVYLCNNDALYSMIYLNDKIEEITGYHPEEFINRSINFPELYHPDDIAKIYKVVEEKLAEQKPFHLIYRIKQRSGVWRWIEEFGTGVFNDDQLIYLEGYLQDITDRREVENKIAKQNEALTKANEELDRFVYSASHDLRSPLSSLLGLINLAQISEPAQISEILRLMKERVEHLQRFIDDITLYSQNSRLDLETEKIHLIQLINECLESLKYSEQASQIQYQVSIITDFLFNGDKKRLKIVLNNIIGNAIKYSDPLKEEKFIKISSERNDYGISIKIEDNGIGIQPQHMNKIFNMFYRGTSQSNGSGLGLYIARETMLKMNGEISISSVYGQGTKVIIDLPF